MKFITVRDLRSRPAAVWRELKTENELVVTNNGKPIALLTPLAEEGLEETLRAVRTAKASEALRGMRAAAEKAGKDSLSYDEIDREIRNYRARK
jgi:antitoxin (DNA-binding transcriptional repressor) of toxin-antitoxin stability system